MNTDGTEPRPRRPRDRTLVIWVGLMAATASSWLIAVEGSAAGGSFAIACSVLALGFLKARFIGMYFMDLRAAPPVLRWLFQGWLLTAFVLVLVMWLLAF